MKILLISPLPPPAGGIATWTEKYLNWAKFNTINVDIVNVSVIGKRVNRINSRLNIFDEIIRTFNILFELKVKLKRFFPNIVHLNTSCSKIGIIRDYLIAWYVKKSKVKLVLNYHCNIEDQIQDKVIPKYFLRRIANFADVNIVLNNYSKEYLISRTSKESELIANFIDEAIINSEKKQVNEKIKSISFVGHIQKSKGIYEIIEIAKHFENIEFNLAGPVANEVINAEIPTNIKFLGVINSSQVSLLLQDSDVFLLPSHTEGFSYALLEAMSKGVPIIATNVGANKDMIETHGGIITNVADISSMIHSIELIQDRRIRETMSEWNISKVKNYYTTEKIMSKLYKIYERI